MSSSTNGSADCSGTLPEVPGVGDCGCDSPTSPSVPSPCYTQAGDVKRYAMVEVRENQTSSCSNSAVSSEQGATTTISSSCPANSSPFYSYTVDERVTIPAVNANFYVTVCDTNQWKVGMWLEHPLGKYPITNILASTNQLELRNSCDDGSEIVGNAAQGSTYAGLALIWPTESACALNSQIESSVIRTIEETSDLCPKNIPDLSGSEVVALWGGISSCVDTCTGEVREGTRCLRFSPNVYADLESILIPSATELTLGSRTFNGVTAPMQLMAWDPTAGKLVRVDIPANGQYVLDVTGGVMTLAPKELEKLVYSSPRPIASGAGTSTGFDLNTLSGVTVPSWATHAIVQVSAKVSGWGGFSQDSTLPYARISVNGEVVAVAGSDKDKGTNSYNTGTAASDFNTVYAQLDDGRIGYNIEHFTGGRSGAAFDTSVKLVGFDRAQTG